MKTINPATESPIAEYSALTHQALVNCIESSANAWQDWRHSPLDSRTSLIHRLGDVIDTHHRELAQQITLEMGKPITQAQLEVQKCISTCHYYADEASKILAPTPINTAAYKSYKCYMPLGPVLGIMPWNYPLWQVMRFAIPTLLAGNTILLKHAPNVTGLAEMLPPLFEEAGFDQHIFTTLVINHNDVPEVIHHDQVAAISFTGSDKTGRHIASLAGAAGKPIVMECGGSDPYIVLSDADIELAAARTVASRMNNSGQVCIAAKRAIVVQDVYEQFKKIIIEKMSSYSPEDPFNQSTQLGPMARKDLIDKLEHQVNQSIAQGAQCLLGGHRYDRPGYFYAPTILEGVRPGMVAFDDELFGPVLSLICVKDEAEALSMANHHRYGLSAVLFTSDLERGEYIAHHLLEAGVTSINDMVSSHPAMPFGGIKASGVGRELGEEGMRAFTNIKTVSINE